MIQTMQRLALVFLWKTINGNKTPPNNLLQWFVQEKKENPSSFFPFLIEPAGKIEKYYTLSADATDDNVAILESADILSLGINSASQLPFIKPSGGRSAQIGPVIKRSYDKKKGAGPLLRILDSTLSNFEKYSKSDKSWASYFGEVVNVFKRTNISIAGEIFDCKNHALDEAIKRIDEKKGVFLVFKDSQNRLPGDVKEYNQYLSNIITNDKYTTKKAESIKLNECYCCGTKNIKGYPAGLTKAGINIFNIDRQGAFPNITNENAYLSYAICENCADLLYIFKFHVSDKYLSTVAGEQTLLLPELYFKPKCLNKFLINFKNYIDKLEKTPAKAIIAEKKQLLKLLAKEEAICSIDMYWGSLKGQNISDLTGNIIDVLPSRLRKISQINNEFEKIKNPVFPKYPIENFNFDLNLSFIRELLFRPGGEKAKGINASRKQKKLKRLLVEAIYKNTQFPKKRFWEEIMITAEWYFKALNDKDKPEIDCLYEGYSEKKNKSWMSFAGWIKHLAMTLKYFNYVGVTKIMENKRTYKPELDELKPYFSDDCGINNNEKAFAFVLGILYGRVMQIQGAKGVNVSSNALTWLKRLTLSGKDLPELYVKVREKLLAYDAENVKIVRALIKEIGILGNVLGDNIKLEQTACCYFLLLGQSLSIDFFPPKEKKENDTEQNLLKL